MLGIETKAVYGLSPKNRWINREDKSEAGTVLKNVCQLQKKTKDGVVATTRHSRSNDLTNK